MRDLRGAKVLLALSLSGLFKTATFALPTWAVTEDQVSLSACRDASAGDPYKIQSFLREYLTPLLPVEKRKIFGLELTGEPRVLSALQALLTLQYNSMGGQTFEQLTFTSSCADLGCILKDPKIFPGGTGSRLVYLYFRYGILASQYVLPFGEPWTLAELTQIEMALINYPSSIFPLNEARPVVRFQKGYTLQGAGDASRLFGNAMIYLFDPYVESDSRRKEIIVYHEFAHVFEFQSWAKSKEWRSLSGWPLALDAEIDPSQLDPQKFVSTYAMNSPAEDFAESVVAYRYSPENFKKENPDKYAFIRDGVFQGVEYDSTDHCKGAVTYSDRAQFWLQAHLPELLKNIPREQTVNIMKFCGEPYLEDRGPKFQHLPDSAFKKCTAQAFGNIAVENSQVLPKDSKVPDLATSVAQTLSAVSMDTSEIAVLKNLVQNRFHELMKDYLGRVVQEQSYLFYKPQDAESLCKEMGRFAYQKAKLNEAFGSTSSLFAHSHRVYLDSIAGEYCRFAQRNNSVADAQLFHAQGITDFLDSKGLTEIK